MRLELRDPANIGGRIQHILIGLPIDLIHRVAYDSPIEQRSTQPNNSHPATPAGPLRGDDTPPS